MINKDKRKYFTAGELAAIFNISKQSLLYYDKVNLLSPDFVSENGYRNYSIQQFLDLEIIVNLRALDISIANIKNIWRTAARSIFCSCCRKKQRNVRQSSTTIRKSATPSSALRRICTSRSLIHVAT